jgi:MATE family multidrug resistance protein
VILLAGLLIWLYCCWLAAFFVMSPSLPINAPARASHHHHHASETGLLSSSYLATSPIAQEILIRDIAECSTEEEDGYGASDSDSDLDESRPLNDHQEQHHHQSAHLAFHPGGIAYGTACLAAAPSAPHCPPPIPREIEESRNAERSLLRDNHLLPPKHRWAGEDRPLRRLYRRVFSTKVRDSSRDNSAILYHKAVETTPLLEQIYEVGPPTPDSDEEHNRWEAAVAAQAIRTTWQREAKTLVQYSGPLIVAFLLHYSVTIGSVLTVGRIGMLELGAVNRKQISHPCSSSVAPN